MSSYKMVYKSILIAIFSILLVSCGSVSDGIREDCEGNDIDACDECNEFSIRNGLLHDLDYLLYLMENNFGLFDVAYRARGIDIRSLFEAARGDVLNIEYIDEQIFGSILATRFSAMNTFAHFGVFNPLGRFERRNNAISVDLNLLGIDYDIESLADIFELDLFDQDVYLFLIIVTSPIEMQLEAKSIVERSLGESVAELFMHSIRDVDFYTYMQIINMEMSVFSTEILNNGDVAYMAIRSFSRFTAEEFEQLIFGFFEKIQETQHLIIDLRGNPGGNYRDFFSLVIEPNIAEALAFNRYHFFIDEILVQTSSYISRFIEESREQGNVFSVEEALKTFDMPELNHNEIRRMDYVLVDKTIFTPQLLSRFGYNPAFAGKIWILVDEMIGSASEVAVRAAQEIGFATLVGELTGGNYGGAGTVVDLPNSGIRVGFDLFYVTDTNGRPLEAGTVPHYFNRQGMDALQTVLVMIEEGQY